MGEYEEGEDKMDAGSIRNPLCSVSGVGSTIVSKSGLKSWDTWLGFVTKQKFWRFWVIVGFGLWVLSLSYEYWVMKIESCPNQTSPYSLFFSLSLAFSLSLSLSHSALVQRLNTAAVQGLTL